MKTTGSEQPTVCYPAPKGILRRVYDLTGNEKLKHLIYDTGKEKRELLIKQLMQRPLIFVWNERFYCLGG